MIRNLQFYQGTGTNPYDNLALEAYFLQHCPPETCILYLWQNRRTVVIGKNQNAWKECNVDLLEQEGGFLARRPSGGGAVFHDLGNLNFTFIAPLPDYNIDRQLEVVCRAVGRLGVNAQKTGRNDITVDGRKFSGNAFQTSKGIGCHHGTLLLDADMAQMARYLNVSAEKLQAKGVSSVKSRVVNLRTLCPSATVGTLSLALLNAFEETYGLAAQRMDSKRFDWEEIRRISVTFASWQWRLGREIPFSYELEERFPWGNIQLRFCVTNGKVSEVQAYSDAMDAGFIEKIPVFLQDLPFSLSGFADALTPLAQTPQYATMVTDLQMLLRHTPQQAQGGESE
ncbi:MAG: lipoate--protein ligase [Oscillospiraceae bacterium]|nr:lipoate--protein ligase [Oscillospiraceae bacterium]